MITPIQHNQSQPAILSIVEVQVFKVYQVLFFKGLEGQRRGRSLQLILF
jgi:hypothetical protein